MALAAKDASAAWELSLQWQDNGGGHPAMHCAAVALVGLKQYSEGATRLELLAKMMVTAPPELRSEVLDQAGQAWILAGHPERAVAALNAALPLNPKDPDLLIDRSEAFAGIGKYWEAIDDLNRAIELDPKRPIAFIYRASAYRQVDGLDLALEDIQRALTMAPDSPDALLERGNIRRLKGDKAGARHDWIRVGMVAPHSAADEAAKANLERLDVPGDPGLRPARRK